MLRGSPLASACPSGASIWGPAVLNGLATNTGRGGTINLKDDCYDDFARFMATALKGIETHDGIHFDYLCPVNEPDGHWNWLGPKQEGSPATNREIARLLRETGRELKRQAPMRPTGSAAIRYVLSSQRTARTPILAMYPICRTGW